MATYYVRPGGSNSNAGTGPGTGQAWLTIGKALGASGIASGDTVWIAPGTYREVVTVAMTSATVETFVNADPSASKFSDINPGPVVWTGYTTNDTTTPSTTAGLLTLSGRDFLTIQDFVMIGADFTNGGAVDGGTAHSTDITLRRCSMMTVRQQSLGGSAVRYSGLASTAANWTIDSCVIVGNVHGISITVQLNATADHDLNFQIKNCFILANGSNPIDGQQSGGTGTFKSGGIDVRGCTLIGNRGFQTVANFSTSIPNTVVGCLIAGYSAALQAGASGNITEDYNVLWSFTPRNNVSTGAHSQLVVTYAPLFEIGQSFLHGFAPRPFFSPLSGSPMLGFGDDGSMPSVDALNRSRPAGGNSTSKGIGYLERHDTAIKETTTTDAGSVAVVIVGPGDHDFKIPVDAASTTISVKARYDATHNTTNKPQAILLANDALGVATETKTMTAAVDTWDTLTFTPFTPSAKGVVTVRLVSRAAAANGKAFFDTFAVS